MSSANRKKLSFPVVVEISFMYNKKNGCVFMTLAVLLNTTQGVLFTDSVK